MTLTDALQNKLKTQFAENFQEAFSPTSEDNYYLFFGKVTSWPDEQTPPLLVDSVSEHFSAQRNGLFAIRIDSRNTMLVVPRINWTSDTIYDEYDDSTNINTEATVKKYYVLVDEDKVYKCISNNSGQQSTAKPTSTSTPIFTTSDGYKWKFLYKLTEDQKDFLTEEYLPVDVANKNGDEVTDLQLEVQKKTVNGGIYRVEVTDSGASYANSLVGENSVRSSTEIGGLTIDVLEDLSSVADAYNGYIFYVSSGPGAGTYRRIVDYTIGDSGKSLSLESGVSQRIVGISESSDNPSKYKILPEILIHGDGEGAICLLNVDNTTKEAILGDNSVTIVNSGRNYKKAFATFPTTGTTAPTVNVNIGPFGGHGSNVIKELNPQRIMIRLVNENVESQPEIINVNDYRQYGIIKNPVLNDNSQRVAGNEFDRKVTLSIRKPFGVSGSPYFASGSVDSTFKKGDFVYGFESKAIAEIDQWQLNSQRDGGNLILKNPSKDFILPNNQDETIRIYFGLSGACGDFNLFETAQQYNESTGLTAEGTVIGWNSIDRELELRLTATGDVAALPFTQGSTYPVTGVLSGATYYGIQSLKNTAGELLGTFGTTTGVFNTLDSKTKIARIDKGLNSYIDSSSTPVYKMTTNLEISGSGFDSSTFSLDEGITQENNRILASAKVASWTASSGKTGNLVITDVVGKFNAGATIESSSLNNARVATITEPDLVAGSGEVLYIQNIRPVARQQNQREEFRISIGF